MIGATTRNQLRQHLANWQGDPRPVYTRADVSSLITDFEWVLGELDRVDPPNRPRLAQSPSSPLDKSIGELRESAGLPSRRRRSTKVASPTPGPVPAA
jgi:hypothetical protein